MSAWLRPCRNGGPDTVSLKIFNDNILMIEKVGEGGPRK